MTHHGAVYAGSGEPQSRPDRRGFTLIELLVVIAIISLLVSILLPSLARAKRLTRMTVCCTNVRSIVMATTLYASERDGTFPFHYGNPGDMKSSNPAVWDIATPLGELTGGFEMFFCPEFKDPEKQAGIEYLSDPTRTGQKGGNYCLYAGWQGTFVEPDTGPYYHVEDVERPSDAVAVADGNQNHDSWSNDLSLPFSGDHSESRRRNGPPVLDSSRGHFDGSTILVKPSQFVLGAYGGAAAWYWYW